MRNRIWLPMVFAIFIMVVATKDARAQYDDANLSYNDFYQNLAPYGQWLDDPQYGYVWSPDVDGTFRPYYTNGHWAMTDYGNTWISNYPWGWAAFHYGRWTFDNYYGWLWVPGSDWGPAWVSWRGGDGYYGWAPLTPGFDYSASSGDYICPADWWVFIPPQYIYSNNYYRYWNGPRNNSQLISNTVYVNNAYTNRNVTYVSGPRQREIEQSTHQPVQIYKVTNSTNMNTRVHNDMIRMYRPAEIRPATGIAAQRQAPPAVVSAPRQVSKPQSITGQSAAPEFRSNRVGSSRTNDAVGTNVNSPAQAPAQPRRQVANPYEWDVNAGGTDARQQIENAVLPAGQVQPRDAGMPVVQPQDNQPRQNLPVQPAYDNAQTPRSAPVPQQPARQPASAQPRPANTPVRQQPAQARPAPATQRPAGGRR